MKCVPVFLVLALLCLCVAVFASDDVEVVHNHEARGIWDAVSKIIDAKNWVWSFKDYIASCGNYKIVEKPDRIIFQWAWVFRKGTYLIYLDKDKGNKFIDACNDPYAEFPTQVVFQNSYYNIMTGIKNCESEMLVTDELDRYVACVKNLFQKTSLPMGQCNACFTGVCPSWNCQ